MITYNHSRYIKKAIQGVFLQKTNLSIEFVISDDCSTDNTVEIIKEELKSIPDRFIINFIERNKNVGVNQNFINALNVCKGDYIAICEGDDYWMDENKLDIQYNFLSKNKQFIMSFHDGYIVNDFVVTDKMILNQSTKRDVNYHDLATVCFTLPTLSVFFKNIINYNLPYQMYSVTNCDNFLFLYLTKNGDAHYHPEIKSVYHVYHEGGIWSMKSMLNRSIKSYNTYRLAYQCFKDRRLLIPMYNFSTSIIIYSIKEKKYLLSIKYYLNILLIMVSYPKIINLFMSKQLKFILKQFNNKH